MFPASFNRSPLFWVFAHRSDPAKSHNDNLYSQMENNSMNSFKIYICEKLMYTMKCMLNILYNMFNCLDIHVKGF